MLAALYQISLKLSRVLVTTRLSPPVSNSGCIAALKVIPMELRFHGLGSVIFNTCMKFPQFRQVEEKTQTVVALDCGLNVFAKVSMLEIQS